VTAYDYVCENGCPPVQKLQTISDCVLFLHDQALHSNPGSKFLHSFPCSEVLHSNSCSEVVTRFVRMGAHQYKNFRPLVTACSFCIIKRCIVTRVLNFRTAFRALKCCIAFHLPKFCIAFCVCSCANADWGAARPWRKIYPVHEASQNFRTVTHTHTHTYTHTRTHTHTHTYTHTYAHAHAHAHTQCFNACMAQLWEKLMGQRLGPGRALAALEEMFSADSSGSRKKCMTLLVVDEIDVLMTKDQGVSVNAFWEGGRGCALVCMRLFVYGAAGGGRD